MSIISQCKKIIFRPLPLMILSMSLLLSGVFGSQFFIRNMIKQSLKKHPPVSVSAQPAHYSLWESTLEAHAALSAIEGIDVTTQTSGIISGVHFHPGPIAKNDLLITLDSELEEAKLHASEALVALAQLTHQRNVDQAQHEAISQSLVDASLVDLRVKEAQVAADRAILNLKIIKAPFSGIIGISKIHLGQYLKPGDVIATLQNVTALRARFSIAQDKTSLIKNNMPVEFFCDALPPNTTINGIISSIDPKVDPQTRHLQIEATITHPNSALKPGMFAIAKIKILAPKNYITLPQTAITVNPYGNTVYVIKDNHAQHRFIKTGETRGDQISILEGLTEGEMIVTSGQVKLKNNTPVSINNEISIDQSPNPKVVDK